MEDAVTDTMAKTVEMLAMGEKWGFDGKDRFAHEGILNSADHIREELDKTGVLETLFADNKVNTTDTEINGDSEAGRKSPCSPSTRHDNKFTYELSITGHSLGAGLASLVAYMLRPRYPLVKCVAFAPPANCFDQATGT